MATSPILLDDGWRKYVLSAAETLILGEADSKTVGAWSVYIQYSSTGAAKVKGVVPALKDSTASYVPLPYHDWDAVPSTYVAADTSITTTTGLDVNIDRKSLVVDVTDAGDGVTVWAAPLRG